MLNSLQFSLIMGHFVGDYILQNTWLAVKKSKKSWICILHCLIYTAAIVAFTWPFIHGVAWTLLIFCSHYFIDRYSLAEYWLRVTRGRSFKSYFKGNRYTQADKEDVVNGSLTAIVYVVIDNTFHMLLMAAAYELLKGV